MSFDYRAGNKIIKTPFAYWRWDFVEDVGEGRQTARSLRFNNFVTYSTNFLESFGRSLVLSEVWGVGFNSKSGKLGAFRLV